MKTRRWSRRVSSLVDKKVVAGAPPRSVSSIFNQTRGTRTSSGVCKFWPIPPRRGSRVHRRGRPGSPSRLASARPTAASAYLPRRGTRSIVLPCRGWLLAACVV
eukprot:scaffold31559_cov32-Tisochrysis_lutea.AAC.10